MCLANPAKKTFYEVFFCSVSYLNIWMVLVIMSISIIKKEIMELLSFGLTYAIAAFGAAIAVGWIGSAALNAAGRNPEKTNDYRTMMVLAIAFADALAIIGLVVAIVGTIMA